MFYQGSETSIS